MLATEEHIFSCGADKTIAVWSVADALRGVATLVGRLAHHNDVVYSLLLAFGALFSSSADKTVRRYALADRAPTLTWEAHSHSVTCLAASEPLGLLCSGAEDGRVCVWRVGETKAEAAGVLCVRPDAGASVSSALAVYALAVEPTKGEVLFSGGADYRIHMWDLRSRTLLHTLARHTSTVRALCFAPKGDRLCSSGGDFNLCVWALPVDDEVEAEEEEEGEEEEEEEETVVELEEAPPPPPAPDVGGRPPSGADK